MAEVYAHGLTNLESRLWPPEYPFPHSFGILGEFKSLWLQDRGPRFHAGCQPRITLSSSRPPRATLCSQRLYTFQAMWLLPSSKPGMENLPHIQSLFHLVLTLFLTLRPRFRWLVWLASQMKSENQNFVGFCKVLYFLTPGFPSSHTSNHILLLPFTHSICVPGTCKQTTDSCSLH